MVIVLVNIYCIHITTSYEKIKKAVNLNVLTQVKELDKHIESVMSLAIHIYMIIYKIFIYLQNLFTLMKGNLYILSCFRYIFL